MGIHLKRGGHRWKTASLYLVLFAFRIIFSPFNIGLTEELGLSIKVGGDITCLIVRRTLKSDDKRGNYSLILITIFDMMAAKPPVVIPDEKMFLTVSGNC